MVWDHGSGLCGHDNRKEVHGARIRWQPWACLPITRSRFDWQADMYFLHLICVRLVKVILMVLMMIVRLH